jgi:hypothetical protein
MNLVVLAAGTFHSAAGDCFVDPDICGVKPFEACMVCADNATRGCCVVPKESSDCYLNPGTCAADEWCELNDHESWNESETTTMGRCLKYQALCSSCSGSFAEDNPLMIPGLNPEAFFSAAEVSSEHPLGTYLQRRSACAPHLICTGVLVPTLPPTCVERRNLPRVHDRPTRERMYAWGKRMLRMGARNLQNTVPDRGPRDQLPQGASREQVHEGVNMILGGLWNAELWGPFVPLTIESTYDELCCLWSNYSSQLSDFQRNRTHANFRNPLKPLDSQYGNAPPCLWCQFDGAYNDENPSVWSLIHALTFNLDATVSEYQFQILQSLPMWLREHLSCPLCRSHIQEHLIELGVPTTHSSVHWAKFFWQAHNFVNEQSEVTRCGSQSCGWGVWTTPPAYKCAGVYRYPWFMPFEQANEQWRLRSEDVVVV